MHIQEIKAIAVDVDGTITDSNRQICISAIEAIRTAEKNGIPIIIVTGNIFFYAYATAILIGTTGGIVAENGGVISEIDSEGIKRMKVLGNIEEVKKAFKYLDSKVKNKNKEYELQKVDDSESRLSEIAVYRTIDEKILKDMINESPEKFNVEIYDTQFAIHITDKNINKGSSLKVVANKFGFKTSEIMAIGDSENDIEFLSVCGLKIAVANADENLKEIADYVCKNKYGDGVKEAIEKFILKGN